MNKKKKIKYDHSFIILWDWLFFRLSGLIVWMMSPNLSITSLTWTVQNLWTGQRKTILPTHIICTTCMQIWLYSTTCAGIWCTQVQPLLNTIHLINKVKMYVFYTGWDLWDINSWMKTFSSKLLCRFSSVHFRIKISS